MTKRNVKVTFLPEGKRATVSSEDSIFNAALKTDADLTSLCGGKGYCGKCQVIVVQGLENINQPTTLELTHISEEKIKLNFRLACQTKIFGDVTVRIPEESRTSKQKLVVMGVEPEITLRPPLKKIYLELPKPTLEDPIADEERIFGELSKRGFDNLTFEYETLLKMSELLRESDWKATFTIYDNMKIVNIEKGDTSDRLFSVAIDIGTTKMASFLVDLTSGKLLHTNGTMNPQIPYGEDVMSRITSTIEKPENLSKLQNAVVSCINNLIIQACKVTSIDINEICEISIVGNTAMHHLFLGLNSKYVALAPYPPVIQRPFKVKAKDIGLNINPAGYVYILPNIAGFVGADAVGDILATEIHKQQEISMLIDIGTNTEVILGNREGLLACSTASGPAFEGAHIKHGMRAAGGAIEKLKIDFETFEPTYQTVDELKPRGICGSGLVDTIAEMLKVGIIDTAGTIRSDIKTLRIRKGHQGLEYVLAWKNETSTGQEDIVLTQVDIREFQKAKAAIHTGVTVLMKKLQIEKENIKTLFIAGAFGFYIDPENARTLGIIPEVPLEIVKFVGNTAGSGARLALKSEKVREDALKLVKNVRYIELSIEPAFEEEYINSMYLPHARIEDYPLTMKRIKAPVKVKIYKK